MATSVRYYIYSATGIYIDLSYSSPAFSAQGQPFEIIGGAGADSVYVPAGTSLDFTQAGTGNDIIYLTGNFTDYVQTGPAGAVYTFSRSLPGGATEVIRFAATTNDDVVYFADGHVVMNAISSGLRQNGVFRQIQASDLRAGGTPAYPITSAAVAASDATRVYVYDSAGVDNIANLPNSRIDGGTGTDTLKLSGSGITLDLSTLNNVAVKGIEKIDLTGSGNNTLKLTFTDMFNLLDATAHKLFIDGNAGDVVERAGPGTWTEAGTDATSFAGHTYNVYTHSTGSAIQKLLIEDTITVI